MNGLAGHHFLHQYPRGGENNMPAHRLDMRLFKEVLRLKFTTGLSHRQIAAALGIQVQLPGGLWHERVIKLEGVRKSRARMRQQQRMGENPKND